MERPGLELALTVGTSSGRGGRAPLAADDSAVGPPAIGSARTTRRLALAALATLPLQEALTFRWLFPIKLCEIALLLAAFVRFFGGSSGKARLFGPLSRREFVALAAFLYISASSLAINTWLGDRPDDRGIYRISPFADGVAEIAYYALAVFAFLLITDLVRRYPAQAVKAWLLGASIAAWYEIYLVIGSLIRFTPPLLPGGSNQAATIGSFSIPRAGTFLEGNFFGLFLLMSLVLALSNRRVGTAILISAALLGSISVINIIAMVVMWIVYLASGTKRSIWTAILLLGVSPLLIFALLGNSVYMRSLTERIFDPQSQSANERRGSVATALRMYADHPVLGVGPAQYGLWFRNYRPKSLSDEYISVRRNTRYIPNNVPAQILAEQGTLGFLCLGTFFFSIDRRGRGRRGPIMRYGLRLVFLSLFAFPTAISVVIWMFFGMVRGLDDL